MPGEAAAPFNKSTADVILRSCDGTDFRLHKAILSEASPVFEQMFNLPQPTTSQSEYIAEIPIIPVSEKSTILDKLLRLCYPIVDLPFESLEDLVIVLEAAVKYDMDLAKASCARALVQPVFMGNDPFAVFAIAYHFKLADEARLAAKETLRFKEPPYKHMPEVLENISAKALYALMLYRGACERAAADITGENDVWNNTIGQLGLPFYAICGTCAARDDFPGEPWIDDEVPFSPDEYRTVLSEILKKQPCGAACIGDILWNKTVIGLAFEKCEACREVMISSLQKYHKDAMARYRDYLSRIEPILEF